VNIESCDGFMYEVYGVMYIASYLLRKSCVDHYYSNVECVCTLTIYPLAFE
jgi:hypothetical protein